LRFSQCLFTFRCLACDTA